MSSGISFGLICRKNPSITDVDDIQSIARLELDHSNISTIDNLELFNHIKEIDLSHNKIKSLKNLEFLTELQVLDLSFNDITSQDLLASFKYIPKHVQTLVLTGNPCAQDEDALGKLQDRFPDLGIAIELVQEEEKEGDEDNFEGEVEDNEENGNNDDDDDETEEKISTAVAPLGPVNADEILKYIVDRKCKLQSMQSFNLENAVKELNSEAEKSMEAFRTKRMQSRTENSEHQPNNLGIFEEKYKQYIEEMKSRNELEKTSYEEVVSRLRVTAQQQLQQIETLRTERSNIRTLSFENK